MPAIQAGVGWPFILKNDQTVFPQSGARTISGRRQEPGLSGSVLALAWLYLQELKELQEPEVAALVLVEAEELGVADKPAVDTQAAVLAVAPAVGKRVAVAAGT